MLLVGERVKLREYRRTDVPVIQKWFNDPEVNRYIAFWVRPYSLPETETLFESQLTQDPNRGVGLVICLKDDPEETYIGGCGLHDLDLRERFAMLGIAILRKDLHGQGLGQDAPYSSTVSTFSA